MAGDRRGNPFVVGFVTASPALRRCDASAVRARRPAGPNGTDRSQCARSRRQHCHTLLTFGFVCTVFHGLQQQSAEDGPERPSVSDVVGRALLNPGYILESTFSPRTVRECDFALDAAATHAATRAHERARELFIRPSLLCPFVPCPSQFTAGSRASLARTLSVLHVRPCRYAMTARTC